MNTWHLVTAAVRLQSRLTLASPLALVGWITTPSMLLCLTVLTRSSSPNPEESTSLMSAVLLASFWASCVWSGVGVLRRDRQNGTLAATVTPVGHAGWVIIGRILGACVITLLGVVLAVVSVGSVLGLHPVVEHPWALLMGLLLTTASGIAASCLIGTILLVSRHGDHISSALGIPITLLGGTVIPIGILPAPAEAVSSLISLSWLQRWLTSTSQRELDWFSFFLATLLTLTYGVLAAVFLKRSLTRARTRGDLELV